MAKSGASLDPAKQNRYPPGTLVLLDKYQDEFKLAKLTPRYECRYVVMGNIVRVHMIRLKPFFGSRDDAWKWAMLHQDQYTIDRITAHRGDPLARTTMEFEAVFKDGSVV